MITSLPYILPYTFVDNHLDISMIRYEDTLPDVMSSIMRDVEVTQYSIPTTGR